MPIPKGRGKLVRVRTIKLPGNKYAHLDVMSKAGKRGGHTVMGPVKRKKAK
jgi:hypothetical protein